MRGLRTMAGALVLGSAAASAQAPTGFDATDVATARAAAQGALERSGGEAVWENVTTTTTPEIRHRASGGICRFWASSVYPGSDVHSYGRSSPGPR